MPEAALARPVPVPLLRPTALLLAALVLAYVAAEIFLYSVHEPYRDEAQGWLMARALQTPLDFFIIPGEGHPPLWYWLQRFLSLGLSFDQARPLMLGVAALNAILLARLFGDRPPLLAALLCSIALLQYWGFYFRPYTLIMTCVAGALLLERARRFDAATWLVAVTCGLHIFGGVLLAFWLAIALRRGTPLPRLVGPALLGAAFGLSAILSGQGNTTSDITTGDFPLRFTASFVALFSAYGTDTFVNTALALVVLGFGLRRSPFILATTFVLLLLLSGFGALVYRLAPWHLPFVLLIILMAWNFDRKAPGWLLVLLLLPQDFAGILRSIDDTRGLASPDEVAYAAVAADAGARLDPPHNLVAWPDFLLSPAATRHDIRYVSGNNGKVIDAVKWRERGDGRLDAGLLGSLPTPYWIVCSNCAPVLATIGADGRTATEILPLTTSLIEPIAAYRVDGNGGASIDGPADDHLGDKAPSTAQPAGPPGPRHA